MGKPHIIITCISLASENCCLGTSTLIEVLGESEKATLALLKKPLIYQHNTVIMIPPNSSLVKYDNPVLVSRNTEKKTPKVISKRKQKC